MPPTQRTCPTIPCGTVIGGTTGGTTGGTVIGTTTGTTVIGGTTGGTVIGGTTGGTIVQGVTSYVYVVNVNGATSAQVQAFEANFRAAMCAALNLADCSVISMSYGQPCNVN